MLQSIPDLNNGRYDELFCGYERNHSRDVYALYYDMTAELVHSKSIL
jgi:hypothetical protein